MTTNFDRIKVEIIVFLFAADNQLQLGNNDALGNIAVFLEFGLIAGKCPRQTTDFRPAADGEISDVNLRRDEWGRNQMERESRKAQKASGQVHTTLLSE